MKHESLEGWTKVFLHVVSWWRCWSAMLYKSSTGVQWRWYLMTAEATAYDSHCFIPCMEASTSVLFFVLSLFFLLYLFVHEEADSRGTVLQTGKPGTWSDSGSVTNLKWLQQRILNQIKRGSHGPQTVDWSLGLLVYLNWLLTKSNLTYIGFFAFQRKIVLNFRPNSARQELETLLLKGKKTLFILSGPVTMSMTLLISG